MGHHCCSKHKVKRGLWSPEEDEKLFNYITAHGHACWSTVPKEAGLQRCGKSCRLRWMNYLKPDLKRGSFSVEEERIIVDVHRILGNRWAQIAKHLPGRTDNEVKNFWNSCIKKKLIAQGLDPKTHNLMQASKTSTYGAAAAATTGNNSDEIFQSPTTTPFTISSPNKGFDRAKGFDKMAIPPTLMAPPQSNVALHDQTAVPAALSDLQCRDSHVLMSFANASSSPSLGHMNAASSSSFINDQNGFMDDCVWDSTDMDHFEALNQIEVGDKVQTCTLGNEKGLMMEAYCGFDLEIMDDSSLLPCGDFYNGGGGGGGGGSMEQLQWHC